MTVFTGL